MIFVSVIPLLKTVSGTLLQCSPSNLNPTEISRSIMSIEGVLNFYEPHFWSNNSDVYIGSIHVLITNTTSEQKVLSQITAILKQHSIIHTAIQIEKEQVNPLTGLPSQIK